jgi:hypothetical protein
MADRPCVCSFLALPLKQELESRMKPTDVEWEWKEVIRALDALKQAEANLQGRRFLLRSQLTRCFTSGPHHGRGVPLTLSCSTSVT